MVRYHFCSPIFHHPQIIHLNVKRLQFEICSIIVGLVIDQVACFQDEGLDVSELHMYKCAVVKVTVMSIEEYYLIFDRGGATYIGELGHGFKPPISIHIPILCVMDCPVQWDVEV